MPVRTCLEVESTNTITAEEKLTLPSSKSPLNRCYITREQEIHVDIPSNFKKDEISFSDISENYCICFVDIVGSTQLTSRIYNSDKMARFYSTFINSIAKIIEEHGGKIMKILGDGLISYFPATCNSERPEAFAEALDCFLAMKSSRLNINTKFMDQKLPPISYRISADYGRTESARTNESKFQDLFGPTVNFCVKMNKRAPPNGIIIGSDLHMTLGSIPGLLQSYHFKEMEGMHVETGKRSYPLYTLLRKREHGERTSLSNTVWGFLKDKGKSGSASRPLTVMLIDDDPSHLLLFTKYLKSEGIIVDSFIDPAEALKQFTKSNESRYDLVITDIRMPKLNGFELYYRFKVLDPSVRVMFVTALDLVEEVFSIMPDVNMNQFLIKPIHREELITCVRKQTGLK